LDRSRVWGYNFTVAMSSQPKLHTLFTADEVKSVVERLAVEIGEEYKDKHPLLIGVLKGCFVFMADLVRVLDFPLEVEFITLSSYGRGRSTPGELKMVKVLCTEVKNRHILVVEDIVDTGRSLSLLIEYLRERKPASLRLCTLLDKPSRRQISVAIDYLGFTVPDKFIVGYGIDWDEQFRYLPDICYVEVEG